MARFLPWLLAVAIAVVGCGDDDTPLTDSGTEADGGAGDAGASDAGSMDGGSMDGGPMDGGAGSDGGTPTDSGPGFDAAGCIHGEPGTLLGDVGVDPVTITGVVSTPATPLPGTLPPGTMLLDAGPSSDAGISRQSGGELTGAVVTLFGPDFVALSTDISDCMGRFRLPGPANTGPLFVRVDPVAGLGGGYAGYVRARRTEDSDLNAGQLTLLLVPELAWRLSELGASYDFDRGWVVQSYASTRTPGGGLEGGEGVVVTGEPNGPSFVVTGTQTIDTSALPPECDTVSDAGVPRGDPVLLPDGGVLCYTDLLEIVFVSSIDTPGPIQIQLVDPPGKTCTQREDVSNWPVFANTVNRVRADCM